MTSLPAGGPALVSRAVVGALGVALGERGQLLAALAVLGHVLRAAGLALHALEVRQQLLAAGVGARDQLSSGSKR